MTNVVCKQRLVKTDPEVWVRGHMGSHILFIATVVAAGRVAERVGTKYLKRFELGLSLEGDKSSTFCCEDRYVWGDR